MPVGVDFNRFGLCFGNRSGMKITPQSVRKRVENKFGKKRYGTVDGINLATPKGFDMESRKPKSPRKNQKLGTIVHLPARMDAILKKIILTLQAASAYTHFRGGVMGSNADLMENGLKP